MSIFSGGTLLSLFPTAFQLLYVFPIPTGKGMMGISLGRLAPAFVCFYNAAWGFSAALWIQPAVGESQT